MKTKEHFMEALETKAKNLIATTWGNIVSLSDIRAWRSQFSVNDDPAQDEQLHAMYLLVHFLYFDQQSIRELLKSIYRDLFRTPLIHSIRRNNSDTTDLQFIEDEFQQVRSRTRFLGVGNPSESGVHLLYYFRQENSLPKTLFIHSHEIFQRDASNSSNTHLRDGNIECYVFVDDLCGSGKQASDYSRDLVAPLKALKPDAKVLYLVLFATSDGLEAVRKLNCFDQVSAVFELDASFRCLDPESRIFAPESHPFIRENIKATCERHGGKLWPLHPLGYKNGQLLLGFNHNTPDNTLPIIWCNEHAHWLPIFKRYHKDYGP